MEKSTFTKTQYQFDVKHFTDADQEPEILTFEMDDYRKAGEKFTLLRISDFQFERTGSTLKGYFPYTTLTVRKLDDEGNELDQEVLATNQRERRQFSHTEPMIEELFEAHEEGKRWFVQNEKMERHFYITESEALTHQPELPKDKWSIFNLDRHLVELEGRNMRYFLNHRPALSTNKIESLCGVGRGTLSKIKNGQRKLNRKQYRRLLPILSYYGYVPHLDLRQLKDGEPNLEVDTIVAEDL